MTTKPTPVTALTSGDLVAVDAPAKFLTAVVRDVGAPRDGRVRITVDLYRDADELVEVVWAGAASSEEVGA